MKIKVNCITCPWFKLKNRFCSNGRGNLSEYFDNNHIMMPSKAKVFTLYLEPPIDCKIRTTTTLVELTVK